MSGLFIYLFCHCNKFIGCSLFDKKCRILWYTRIFCWVLHTWWRFKNNELIAYTEMGGLLIINVLVYTHNVVLLVTSSIGLKTSIGNLPKNLFEFYTPISGSPDSLFYGLHTFKWLFQKLDQYVFTHLELSKIYFAKNLSGSLIFSHQWVYHQ